MVGRTYLDGYGSRIRIVGYIDGEEYPVLGYLEAGPMGIVSRYSTTGILFQDEDEENYVGEQGNLDLSTGCPVATTSEVSDAE